MIQALIGPVASLLDKFIPDATEKQRLAAEIATMAERHGHEIALAQIDVNKEEAKQDISEAAGDLSLAGLAVLRLPTTLCYNPC
jgi:hypothetical protein